MYEYGCSRYKTIMYWNFGFTFMEIPEELNGKIDPTQAIVYKMKYTPQMSKLNSTRLLSSFLCLNVSQESGDGWKLGHRKSVLLRAWRP